MMTLHKLHAGNGYTYLTRQVAAGDEGRSPGQLLADYYTASGNPPGRWVGAGAADLQVTGRVREEQMRALFGRGMHPDAEQIVALEVAAGASPKKPPGRRSSVGRSRSTRRCGHAPNVSRSAWPSSNGRTVINRHRWCGRRSRPRNPAVNGVRWPAMTWCSRR
jgi:hypothetical protein